MDNGEKANKYSSNGQDDQDGGWVNVSSGTGAAWQSPTKGRKTIVVVVDGQKKAVLTNW